MGSDFYLFSVILTVFESGGDNSKHLLGNQSDDNFTVPTTMPNPSQTIFWGSREKHQEVFPRGDNCFLMIFTKPNKSFWIRKILNGFWHSKGFVAFLELQFTFVTFLHDERHLALGHFASLVHFKNSFGRGTKYSFIIWSENWLRDEPTYPAL